MRLVLFMSSCLLISGTARAMEPVEVVTANITGPRVDGTPWLGPRFGATFSMPLTVADASDVELGISTGVSATMMKDATFGVGLDLQYHYWPTSDAFKAELNRLLSRMTLNTLMLGGSTWRIRVIQMTAHLKQAVPIGTRSRPWVKVGAGVYRTDPNTRGYTGDAGFFHVRAQPLPTKLEFGSYGELGFDIPRDSGVRFGLLASYHHVWCEEDLGADFQTLTIGGNVTFGH
jgi:hypothetical protein